MARRRCLASRAATKTEAKRLAFERERRFERQNLGLEPAAIADGHKSGGDLLEWWIENFLKNQASYENVVLTSGSISSDRRSAASRSPRSLLEGSTSAPNRAVFAERVLLPGLTGRCAEAGGSRTGARARRPAVREPEAANLVDQ